MRPRLHVLTSSSHGHQIFPFLLISRCGYVWLCVGMCGYAVGMVYEDQAKSVLKRSLLTADDAVWTNLLTV